MMVKPGASAWRGDSEITTLISEKRMFQPGGMVTTEVGLLQTWRGDLYLVMGDLNGAGARAVRVYFNPLVALILLGAAIMFAGGIISLTDRRFRVGAPKRSARLNAQPAE